MAINDEEFGFWREWYTAILNGNPLPWDLSFRIATELSDEDWDKGPAHVAQLIEPIWRDYRDAPLDQDALNSHLTTVVSQPIIFADAAESTSNLISESVARFKNEEPKTNCLPDGYQLFEAALPTSFGKLSTILRDEYDDKDEQIADLKAEVNTLNGLVQQLRGELKEARLALSEARLSSLEAQQIRTFGERLQTTLTNVTLVGALGMSTLSFFGVSAADLRYDPLKEQLQGLAKDMQRVRPAEEADSMTSSRRPRPRPDDMK